MTVLLENGEHTYECVYNLPIVDQTMKVVNVHLTAEGVTNFTVDTVILK